MVTRYWLESTSEPLTLRQIHDQRHRLSPASRCAVVGSNEWKPILEIIPDLFGDAPPVEPPIVNDQPLIQPVSFSRHSGWVTFFYVLAALNAACGIGVAILTQRTLGLVAGFSASIVYLFFAFVTQLLVDIRWLLEKK